MERKLPFATVHAGVLIETDIDVDSRKSEKEFLESQALNTPESLYTDAHEYSD